MTKNIHKKHAFKRDRYSRARGGNSRFLNIYCSGCRSHLTLYQKDGPGALLRMYLDRIFAPAALAALQNNGGGKKEISNLQCPKCQALIGTPMIYKMEDRPAFHLRRGSFTKRSSDGTYPSPTS